MSEEQNYFAILPEELVLYILKLLDYESMLEARECCILFETLLTPRFEDSSLFMLDQPMQFNCGNAEHNWVFKTNKELKNVCFHEYNFYKASNSDIEAFWNLHGENINYLHFNDCEMAKDTLYSILDKVINLKTLKLDSFNSEIDGATIIYKLYDRCVEISFSGPVFIDKNIIGLISGNRQTTIEEFNLRSFSTYKISCKDIDIPWNFQESGIYQLLKRLKPKLKRFQYSPAYFWHNFMQHIAQLNLNLTEFIVSFGDQLDNSDMLMITSQMKNLQKLHIKSSRFTDQNANLIYNNLHELRSLKFDACDLLTNEGIINVKNLKRLEHFSLDECLKITNTGIVNGIASKPNHILRRLHLEGCFSDDMLISIVNNLTMLEALTIRADLFISPHLIPLIYKRITNLKEFDFEALNEPDTFEIGVIANNLSEEQLQNANVKISVLKNLLVLKLNGCGLIPGATFSDIADLPKLQQLTLNHYRAISKDEIIQLTKLKSLRKVWFHKCNDFLKNEEDLVDILKVKLPKTTFIFNGLTF